jgi:hypothetical protein
VSSLWNFLLINLKYSALASEIFQEDQLSDDDINKIYAGLELSDWRQLTAFLPPTESL